VPPRHGGALSGLSPQKEESASGPPGQSSISSSYVYFGASPDYLSARNVIYVNLIIFGGIG